MGIWNGHTQLEDYVIGNAYFVEIPTGMFLIYI